MRVAVVDVGTGNVRSMLNALDSLGVDCDRVDRDTEIAPYDRVVLPGVGSFAEVRRRLSRTGLDGFLDGFRTSGRPVLGVCLGMQLMARSSTEGGVTSGLGWIDAPVEALSMTHSPPRVPHMGWNSISLTADHPVFRGINEGDDVYFVHSYHVGATSQTIATCDHGGPFVAAIGFENVVAVQFHPEKSQEVGLTFLDNYLQWKP